MKKNALQFWPVAGNKGPRSRSTTPPPIGVGRRMERKRQKTRGLGEGQLNRTANEANSNNNNTDKENIQNKQRNAQSDSQPPMPCALQSCESLPPGQLPHPEHSMMARGIKYPVLFGQFGSACPLCPLLASGENYPCPG